MRRKEKRKWNKVYFLPLQWFVRAVCAERLSARKRLRTAFTGPTEPERDG